MATRSDWLPAGRSEQLAMAKNWGDIIAVQTTAWGIPPSRVTELADLTAAAEDALTEAVNESTRTPVATARCKAAFFALTENMRDLKRRFFLKPPLTDADEVSLGLVPHDSGNSPIPPPTAQPDADLFFPGIHLVGLRDIHPIGDTPLDARSDYGVRIYYGLSGDPSEKHRFRVSGVPKTGKDLPESLFTRRKKEWFDFDGESGKTVYFCLQYETPSGGERGKGPFGPIMSAVIP